MLVSEGLYYVDGRGRNLKDFYTCKSWRNRIYSSAITKWSPCLIWSLHLMCSFSSIKTEQRNLVLKQHLFLRKFDLLLWSGSPHHVKGSKVEKTTCSSLNINTIPETLQQLILKSYLPSARIAPSKTLENVMSRTILP